MNNAITPTDPFHANGLTPLSVFETAKWRELFDAMEREQQTMLQHEKEFRSPEYKWPKAPLHTWSRCWEYPYVYEQLAQWRYAWDGTARPKVLDLGSGVTFFPFAAAKLGCDCECTDIDPVCVKDIVLASKVVPHEPGSVEFRISEPDRLPYPDASLDAAYCISVLEHIPCFENTIQEVARVLKPGAPFFLTIDLDLRGDSEIGPARHRDLKAALSACFAPAYPEATAHPVDLLTSENGPFPVVQPRGLARLLFYVKQLVKPVFGKKPMRPLPFRLCVECLSLKKR